MLAMSTLALSYYCLASHFQTEKNPLHEGFWAHMLSCHQGVFAPICGLILD